MSNVMNSNPAIAKPYWYEYITEICPACGYENTWKRRSYTPKPANRKERYKRKEVWCGWC